jgi:hypothetical protein
VLVLGSSRTLQGLEVGRIASGSVRKATSIFNFGIAMAGPARELSCLRRLLNSGIKPELVIIEVIPATLSQRHSRPMEDGWLQGSEFQFPEMESLAPYTSRPWRLRYQWCLARCFPCCSQSQLPKQLNAKIGWLPQDVDVSDEGMDGYGYRAIKVWTTPDDRMRLTNMVCRQFKDALDDSPLASGPIACLRGALAMCRAEGIRTALLLMPETEALRALYSPRMCKEVDALLGELARTFDAPVIDARNWVEDDKFWDAHHLLPNGAAVFTERFSRDSLAPMLTRLSERWADAAFTSVIPRR